MGRNRYYPDPTKPVRLNDAEVRIGVWNGKSRNASRLKANSRDDKMNERADGERIAIEGVLGEIAFCKLWNLFPDFAIGKTDLADCFFRNFPVDAKATRTDWLLVHLKKAERDHPERFVYACMKMMEFDDDGYPTVFLFIGWNYATEVFKPENIDNKGHGDTYCMGDKPSRPMHAPDDFEPSLW